MTGKSKPGSVGELLRELKAEGAMEKLAAQGGLMSPEDEEMYKLAEELHASGILFGRAAVEGMLQKLAEEAAGATGTAPASVGNEGLDASKMKQIANKLMGFQGMETPGSAPGVPGEKSPNTLAEETAPPQVKSPNPA